MAKLLTRCPVCESALGVTELQCGRCKTTIHGSFQTCRFCRLAPEHLSFVELFLRCEGNLSRVEKELNLSYPTVRNKLQAAIAALGFTAEAEAPRREGGFLEDFLDSSGPPPAAELERAAADSAERRREILDALARGDMSAEEAAEALRDLS
jgi:hypothetical protein